MEVLTGNHMVTQGELNTLANLVNTPSRNDSSGGTLSSSVTFPSYSYRGLRNIHSFTTRRSSDLVAGEAHDASEPGVVDGAGDVINYQVLVSNTGNVDLTGVTVTDEFVTPQV